MSSYSKLNCFRKVKSDDPRTKKSKLRKSLRIYNSLLSSCAKIIILKFS